MRTGNEKAAQTKNEQRDGELELFQFITITLWQQQPPKHIQHLSFLRPISHMTVQWYVSFCGITG